METTTNVVVETPSGVESWFQKMIAKIMKVIGKLLLKFGIKLGM